MEEVSNRPTNWFLLGIFIFYLFGCEALPKKELPGSTIRITRAFESLSATKGFEPALVGIYVKDLEKNKVIFAHNHKKSFLPASNIKLFTSSLALEKLGPSFQTKTELLIKGKIINGFLNGDLILKCSGDPSFGAENPEHAFDEFVEALWNMGIRNINGNIIVDDTLFEEIIGYGKGWEWDALTMYYAPPFGAAVYYGNIIEIKLIYQGNGIPPKMIFYPFIPKNFEIINMSICRPVSINTFHIIGFPAAGKVYAKGFFPFLNRPFKWRIPVGSPSLYIGEALKRAVIKGGIGIDGGVFPIKDLKKYHYDEKKCKTVKAKLSPSLFILINKMLKESNNLYAENIFRLTSIKEGRCSFNKSRKLLIEFLKHIGVDLKGFYIADGSGLSRLNSATPAQIGVLLEEAMKRDWFPFFFKSLPIGGVDGTLKFRFRNTHIKGRIVAKTGTLSRVSALSGYITRKNKKPIVFSVLLEGYVCPVRKARKVIDEFILKVAEICSE